jgi:cobalamin biosynthesis protein CobW
MKIPVTIFSGFLGAGKTTLICDLLRQCPNDKFAILVNEFGSVSIDGQTLAEKGLKNATIFNVVGGLVGYGEEGDSVATLLDVAEDHCPDRLLVETSGLAVPTAIAERLSAAQLASRFQLDAIVTVVDTPWLLSPKAIENLPTAEVFVRQISAADIVILNKIDDLTHQQLANAEQLVRSKSPDVRFLELAHRAEVDPAVLLGVHLHESRHNVVHAAAGNTGGFDGHSHSGLDAHEHGLLTHTHLHEHDPGWLSFVLHTHEAQDGNRLVRAVEELTGTQPILRAKGFFEDRSGDTMELQGVRQRIAVTPAASSIQPDHHHHHHHHHHHDHHHHDHHHNDHHHHHHHHHHAELVFIGYHLDRNLVAEKLSEATGTEWD